jgi:hypothetical protein
LRRRAGRRPPAPIPGLSLRARDGTIVASPGAGPVLPLDELPSLLAAGAYRPEWLVNLEFARGCLRRCKFCAWRRHGQGMRTASRERMRSDVALALGHPVRTACILDSALNTDGDHLARLVEAWNQADPAHTLGVRGFVDLPALTPAQAALLRGLRIEGAEVGLNTVNPAALAGSGREPIDPDDFERKLDLLADVCPIDLHLMIGLPGDDLAGILRTLDFTARQLDRFGPERLPHVTVFWMVVEQGSHYFRHRERLGLVVQEPGMPYVLSTARLPRADLVAAARAIRDHRLASRFHLEGPRALLEGIVPPPPV